MTDLGSLYMKMYLSNNPVTRAVYRDIIAHRLGYEDE